jgi:hypothetical protein
MNPISTLPTYEADSFSRWLVKATMNYFENPDVKKRFKEWKKERESNADRKNEESATA